MRALGTAGPTGFRLSFNFAVAALLTLRVLAAAEPAAPSLEDRQPASWSDALLPNGAQTVPDGQQGPQPQTKQPPSPAAQAPEKAEAGPTAPKKESPYAGFWPSWFQMGITYRGRFEHPSGRGYTADDGDGYYLNRIRLEAALKIGKSVDLFAMTQDARVGGYDTLRTPLSGMVDALDLRQAYIDMHGNFKTGSLALRVGRQNLDFGSRRLIGRFDLGQFPAGL